MRKGTGTLEFAKNGFFVGEQITQKAVAVAFMHGEGCVLTWAQDARCKNLCQTGDKGFIGRG